ncbi:hypothetical protein TIFTF001_053771, partial [Ficus carica]
MGVGVSSMAEGGKARVLGNAWRG